MLWTNYMYYVYCGIVQYEDGSWRRRISNNSPLEIFADNGFGELIPVPR